MEERVKEFANSFTNYLFVLKYAQNGGNHDTDSAVKAASWSHQRAAFTENRKNDAKKARGYFGISYPQTVDRRQEKAANFFCLYRGRENRT